MAKSNPTELDRSLARIEKKQAEWKAKHKNAVIELQLKCKHLALAECTYLPFTHGGALPPVRICLACGMTEDGWHCGNLVLSSESKRDGNARKGQLTGSLGVQTIDRDDLYRRRRGLALRSCHQGPLLRREVTLQQLIRDPDMKMPERESDHD